MSFGNVELNNAKEGEDKNAAEMVIARGFGSVVRHRSDEERSSVYETLLELEEKSKQVSRGFMQACTVWGHVQGSDERMLSGMHSGEKCR